MNIPTELETEQAADQAAKQAARTEARAVEAAHQALVSAARRALAPLLALEYDWDSYRGYPVAYEVAGAGARLLVSLAEAGHPKPALVPTSPGGLALEWHAPGFDLDISLDPGDLPADPPVLGAYFRDEVAGVEWESTDPEDAMAHLPAALVRLAEIMAAPAKPDRLAGMRVREGDPAARLPYFDVATLLGGIGEPEGADGEEDDGPS